MRQKKLSEFRLQPDKKLKEQTYEEHAELVSTSFVQMKSTGFAHGFFQEKFNKVRPRYPGSMNGVYGGVFYEETAEFVSCSRIF